MNQVSVFLGVASGWPQVERGKECRGGLAVGRVQAKGVTCENSRSAGTLSSRTSHSAPPTTFPFILHPQ